MVADTTPPSWNSAAWVELQANDIAATGSISPVPMQVTGAVDRVYNRRQNRGRGGRSFGGPPPEVTPRTGGDPRAGGRDFTPDAGDDLEPKSGEYAPSIIVSSDNQWTNPEAVYVSDSTYASTTVASSTQSYSGFAVSIPESNEVRGVAVDLKASASLGSSTIGVSLSFDGGATFSEMIETPVLTQQDTIYTIGASDELWGEHEITPEDLTGEDFHVRLRAFPYPDAIIFLDAFLVRPTHQSTGGGTGGGASPF